jgi:colanic acid/amylovoran biosynthesis glycosyltransferase
VRVAFLVSEFPAISETFVLDQIAGLIDRGCTVDVYANELHPQAVAHPDVSAYRLLDRAARTTPPLVPSMAPRVRPGFSDVARALPKAPVEVLRALSPLRGATNALKLKPFYRLLPFLGKEPYDVVHAHFGPSGMVGVELRALGAFRAPLITQFHGYDASEYVRQHGRAVYAELFKEGQLFLCVSERIRARLIELGCAPERCVVHRTGVRVADIPFRPVRERHPEALRLLTVSRLVEKKGIEYALRAAALLLPSYRELELSVVGDGPEGDKLRALRTELGLADHVDFLGARSRVEVSALMSRADVMLCPSVTAKTGDEEGIPVVLMEALAAGLPVVSTQHAGIPELVEPGVTGLLAPEHDHVLLAEHVRFIAEQPKERAALVNAGRAAVERSYDVNRLNDLLLEQYRRARA